MKALHVESSDLTNHRPLGSTFIELDEVRVPVENRIGEENKGFPLIMSSKSHPFVNAFQYLIFIKISTQSA